MGSLLSVFSNDSMGSRIFVHVAEDEIENIPLHEDIFDTDSEEEDSEDEGFGRIIVPIIQYFLQIILWSAWLAGQRKASAVKPD